MLFIGHHCPLTVIEVSGDIIKLKDCRDWQDKVSHQCVVLHPLVLDQVEFDALVPYCFLIGGAAVPTSLPTGGVTPDHVDARTIA
jgi:hypothetical protein